MACDCEAVLRADAEALLEQADRIRKRTPRNAEVCERQAMSLALAAGYLRKHEKEKDT